MFYLPKPLRLLNKFGRQRFSGQDFINLVHECGIELILSPDTEKGYYYYSKKGKHVIVLSTRISRSEREQVAWHEFAHFLQNYRDPVPMRACYCKIKNRSQRERFADGFAFVCMTGVPLCGRMDFIRSLMAMD